MAISFTQFITENAKRGEMMVGKAAESIGWVAKDGGREDKKRQSSSLHQSW